MKSLEWKTYRTRFLVKAKQLNSSLSFTDHLGRQHCGRKGDYLVESCDGVLSIAPRQIFEDIYVAMCLSDQTSDMHHDQAPLAAQKTFRFEPLRIERTKTNFPAINQQDCATSDKISRGRKSPQPIRTTAIRLSLM